jgi:hypothetical protein
MLFTALSAYPLLAWYTPVTKMPGWLFTIGFIFIFLAAIAPSTLYFVAQRCSGYTGWKTRMLSLPALMAMGVGIAVSNTRAWFSAVLGRKGSFVRTPKTGGKKHSFFRQKFPYLAIIELAVGAYCIVGVLAYIGARKFIIGPFLALYAIGFLAVGALSFIQYFQNMIDMHRAQRKAAAAAAAVTEVNSESK